MLFTCAKQMCTIAYIVLVFNIYVCYLTFVKLTEPKLFFVQPRTTSGSNVEKFFKKEEGVDIHSHSYIYGCEEQS